MSEPIVVGGLTYHVLFPDLFRDLTSGELERLRTSARQHGILVAVVVDERNGVIDGAHRLQIAAELGLASIPLDVLPGLTLDEKRARAEALNDARRHLSPEERAARAVQLRQEGLSYREIGERLGVDPMTARKDVLQTTVEDSTVALPDRIVGRDGKERPATRPSEHTRPDYPHSARLRHWIDVALSPVHVIDVEKGGIGALLQEPEKWDWQLVQEYILPQLQCLVESLDQYKNEIKHAADQR